MRAWWRRRKLPVATWTSAARGQHCYTIRGERNDLPVELRASAPGSIETVGVRFRALVDSGWVVFRLVSFQITWPDEMEWEALDETAWLARHRVTT